MRNRLYNVPRNDIYVGKVVKKEIINSFTEEDKIESETLSSEFLQPYRSILFVPNENRLTNDLLYLSPEYPIAHISDELIVDSQDIIVNDAQNLAILLEYFGYGSNLSYEDIMKIRRVLFSGHFAQDNCELFGYRKTDEHGIYDIIGNEELPQEFFYLLDKFGGNTLFGQENRFDAFKPAKGEGRIRRLPR